MLKKYNNNLKRQQVHMDPANHGKGAGFVFVFCISILAGVLQAEENLKTCFHEDLSECPRYSSCSRLNAANSFDLKCICYPPYQRNPNWLETPNTINTTSSSTFSNTDMKENYCRLSVPLARNEVDYAKHTVKHRHLVLDIIFVLSGVILFLTILYGLQVLRPLKRTKAAYKKLKKRRQNITPLDDLEVNQRYEKESCNEFEV